MRSVVNSGNKIATDGLIFYIDAANKKSYPGSGTIVNDLLDFKDGTLTNGPTYNSGNGGYFSFDGVNDHIRTDWNEPFGTTLYSYEVWFRTSVGQIGFIIAKRTPANNFEQFSLFMSANGLGTAPGGKLAVYHRGGSSSTIRSWATVDDYNDGNWHHVVLAKGASSDFMYVDGDLKFEEPSSVLPNLTTDPPLLIAASNASSSSPYTSIGSPFNGDIAVAKVYNKTLSASEVLQNYNELKYRFV